MPLALALLAALAPAPLGAQTAASPAQGTEFTVESFVRAALDDSPEVRQAREGFEAAKDQWISQLGAAYLPTVSFSGTAYPYGHNPSNSYRFQTWRLNRSDMSFNTALNWNLFNSFQDWQKTRSSSLAKEASEAALSAARQSRAFVALKAFYALILQKRLLDVDAENLEAQKEQYRLTQDLYRNGMKSLSDLLKSETDLRSSELRMATAEAEHKRALMEFNSLLDRNPWEPARLREDLEPGTTDLPKVEADLERARSLRPELLKSRAELARSGVALEQAAQGVLPVFAVNLDWSRQDLGSFGLPSSSFGIPSPNYQMALGLSLPFGYNILSQAANYLAARADKRRALGAYEAVLRQVREDVYGSFVALERSTAAHRIAVLKEAIAERNLAIVSEQYRQGSADVIRLAQARLDHLNARVERTQALHDIAVNRALYRLSVGEALSR